MSKREGGIKVSQKSKFKVNKSCPSISLLLLFAVIRLCLQIFHVSAFIVYNSLSCTLQWSADQLLIAMVKVKRLIFSE